MLNGRQIWPAICRPSPEPPLQQVLQDQPFDLFRSQPGVLQGLRFQWPEERPAVFRPAAQQIVHAGEERLEFRVGLQWNLDRRRRIARRRCDGGNRIGGGNGTFVGGIGVVRRVIQVGEIETGQRVVVGFVRAAGLQKRRSAADHRRELSGGMVRLLNGRGGSGNSHRAESNSSEWWGETDRQRKLGRR